MEVVIGIGIGIGAVIAALAGKRKKRDKNSMPYDPSKANTPGETAEGRKRRETGEIITVVLPTVNNDK